jgi:hypothetical protein
MGQRLGGSGRRPYRAYTREVGSVEIRKNTRPLGRVADIAGDALVMRRPSSCTIGVGALLVLLALVSGCGGQDETPHYTATTTVSCLERQPGVRDLNTSRRDISVLPATETESVLKMGTVAGNVVIVVFRPSPEDAQEYADAFAGFYRKFGSFGYFTSVRANVASLWQKAPSSRDEHLLDRCLSEGGSAIPLQEQDPSSARSFDYGAGSRAAYVAECVQAGFARGTCGCLVDWAQERYPENTFPAEFRRRAVLSAVMKSCRDAP